MSVEAAGRGKAGFLLKHLIGHGKRTTGGGKERVNGQVLWSIQAKHLFMSHRVFVWEKMGDKEQERESEGETKAQIANETLARSAVALIRPVGRRLQWIHSFFLSMWSAEQKQEQGAFRFAVGDLDKVFPVHVGPVGRPLKVTHPFASGPLPTTDNTDKIPAWGPSHASGYVMSLFQETDPWLHDVTSCSFIYTKQTAVLHLVSLIINRTLHMYSFWLLSLDF